MRRNGGDLTSWLEYTAEGLRRTLESVWSRIGQISTAAAKIMLRPKQEDLLRMLRQHGGMAPREIWKALAVSRQGAMDVLKPLLEAGLVKRVGTRKSGRYVLV